jgi:hypothetical protein
MVVEKMINMFGKKVNNKENSDIYKRVWLVWSPLDDNFYKRKGGVLKSRQKGSSDLLVVIGTENIKI